MKHNNNLDGKKEIKTQLEKILEKARNTEFIPIKFTLPPDLFKWIYIKSRHYRNHVDEYDYIGHLIMVRKGYFDRANKRKKK